MSLPSPVPFFPRSFFPPAGVTICKYQVARAKEHIKREGLEDRCRVIEGNFLDLPFEDGTFDAVYGIEATCHAPKLEQVYSEVYRVLKPGGRFAVYEWVKTKKYNDDDPEDVQLIKDINIGNGALHVEYSTFWRVRVSVR